MKFTLNEIKKMDYNNLDDHIDGLVNILDSIEPNGSVYLLTGSNGSGKSLIRSQLPHYISRKLNVDAGSCTASTSMALRTGSNPEMGGLSGMMRDTGWLPTSMETFDNIIGLLKVKDRFLTIDEPEIGMGEETIMSLCSMLNDKLKELSSEEFKGCMIITHNRYLVENLDYDYFLNTDGYSSKNDWLNRKIIPINIDELMDNKLSKAINNRTNKK